MAKANKKAMQGMKRMTFVRSKRYDEHERNPRGTFKPAVLNEAMEQSKNRLLQVNKTASLIFSSIRDVHNDGSLWPRLLSVLRLQLKEKNYNDVHCLLNLECHAVHTLQNLLRSNWYSNKIEIDKRQLSIALSLDKAPKWKTKNMHQFQLSFYVIYPDLARNKLHKEIVHSEVFSLFDYPEELSFVVPVPARAAAYAVFMKVTGCINGVPENWLQSTGMRCVEVGTIERKQPKPGGQKAATNRKKPNAGSQKSKTTNRTVVKGKSSGK
ncbi:hypothetical protein FAM09_18800 [Niastella caeni]|uniref:Uncharacterized protein n=1 Tax=Niastella caeni TaxID=2569763 RepID=A0A4V4H0L4_9BACT|nr:hypothetical protein [Niastella caeni]THU37006.1 hypothetical protein FAM09_18800 [Niastella caeni]